METQLIPVEFDIYTDRVTDVITPRISELKKERLKIKSIIVGINTLLKWINEQGFNLQQDNPLLLLDSFEALRSDVKGYFKEYLVRLDMDPDAKNSIGIESSIYPFDLSTEEGRREKAIEDFLSRANPKDYEVNRVIRFHYLDEPPCEPFCAPFYRGRDYYGGTHLLGEIQFFNDGEKFILIEE